MTATGLSLVAPTGPAEPSTQPGSSVVGEPRRIALCPAPAEHESFSSWVDRIALDIEAQRRDLWRWFGLIPEAAPRSPGQPLAYGVDLSPAERTAIGAATGVTNEMLDLMLLSRYSGITLDPSDLDRQRPASVTAWARRSWTFIFPSLACPACLTEQPGVWHTAWKFPWSFACTRHGLYLSARCHECGARWQSGAIDARQSTQCCASPPMDDDLVASGARRRRRTIDAICGASPADAPHLAVGKDVLSLQTQINARLAATTDSDRRAAHDELAAFRALFPMVLYMGGAHLAAEFDDAAQTAWAAHISDRESAVPRRGPTAAGQYRSYSLPPTNPLVTAVALGAAARLHLHRDAAAWRRFSVSPDGEVVNTTPQWTQLLKFWTPPAEHEHAMNAVRDEQKFSVSAALDGRSTHAQPPHPGVGADQVPALLSVVLTRDTLPVPLKDLTASRRYAAMALARTLKPSLKNWHEAAQALGIQPKYVTYCDRMQSKIRQAGVGGRWHEQLTSLAQQLADTDNPTNFGARRRAFRTWIDFEDEDWEAVCLGSSIDPADPRWSQRRPLAAAWVWESITGGDWHGAPSLKLDELSTHEREMQAQRYVAYFTRKQLHHVEIALQECVSTLLSRESLDGTSDSWLANGGALERTEPIANGVAGRDG